MPLVRTSILLPDVIKIMHSRGYGDHHDRRYALTFNRAVPGEVWKSTGEPKRAPVGGGVSKEQLQQILKHSETEEEAANRVEAVMLGTEMLPIDSVQSSGNGIDTGTMERMVENRIDNQIGRHVTPILEVLGRLTDRLEAMEQKLTSPTAPPKNKGGRPKGSKNKRKDEPEPKIDFGPRAPSDVTK